MRVNELESSGAARERVSLVSVLRARAIRHMQLIKYFFIGGTASAIDVLLFMVIYNIIGTVELVAHSISVPTSVLFSFTVNARHNFHTNDYMALRLACFSIVCFIGFVAGYGVIEFGQFTGMGANAGKVLSLPVVFIIQYVLNSRVTFRKVKAVQQSTQQELQ